MRHQESEDELASGNREEWTPISDKWWSQHPGGPTHGGRNQDGLGVRIGKGVSHPGSGDYRVCDGVYTPPPARTFL